MAPVQLHVSGALITPSALYRELRLLEYFDSRTQADLASLVRAICDTSTTPGDLTKLTTRKKIFATLVLMERNETIEDFIQENLYDAHLPFQLRRIANREMYWVSTRQGQPEETLIRLFSTWKIHEREYFERYQWQFLSPFFELISQQKPRPLHYVLEDSRILPFVEDDKGMGSGLPISGGYSEVWHVKIRAAHHNSLLVRQIFQDIDSCVLAHHSMDRKPILPSL